MQIYTNHLTLFPIAIVHEILSQFTPKNFFYFLLNFQKKTSYHLFLSSLLTKCNTFTQTGRLSLFFLPYSIICKYLLLHSFTAYIKYILCTLFLSFPPLSIPFSPQNNNNSPSFLIKRKKKSHFATCKYPTFFYTCRVSIQSSSESTT